VGKAQRAHHFATCSLVEGVRDGAAGEGDVRLLATRLRGRDALHEALGDGRRDLRRIGEHLQLEGHGHAFFPAAVPFSFISRAVVSR